MTSRATNRRREDVQCVPHASSSDGAVLRGTRTLVSHLLVGVERKGSLWNG